MRKLEEVLQQYSRHRPVIRHEFATAYKTRPKGDPWGMVPVENHQYQISGRAHHLHQHSSDGVTIALYVDDKTITEKDSRKMAYPLSNYPDSNEIYYGLYLNMLAFLHGGSIAKLWLIARELDNKIIPMKFIPGIAQAVVDHFMETNNKLPSQLKGKQKAQTNLFY